MSQPLRVRCAISPDADDLFMFRALMLGLLPTPGFVWEIQTADTEALNRRADRSALEGGTDGDLGGGLPEVSAVSIASYPWLADRWQLLPHGASIGRGYGPVLVGPRARPLAELEGRPVGVPGLRTTARLVLGLAQRVEPVVLPIVPPERVFQALRDGEVEAAVLIHEGRLVYPERGLVELLDLGAFWERTSGLPLPLGGNVIRRDLGPERIAAISAAIRASIAHGLAHREEAIAWLLQRGGPLQRAEQVDAYLRLYANEDTLDYGEDGRRAVGELLRRGAEAGLVPAVGEVDFAP